MTTTKKQPVPDFSAILADQFAKENSAWHTEPSMSPSGKLVYHWHASSLGGCMRAAILKRANMAHDPTPLNSALTLAHGTMVHALFEKSLPTFGAEHGVTVVAVEQGGPHTHIPLKAKPDAVIIWDGHLTVCDWKTEAGFSARMRPVENPDGVRDEHKVQITAGAIIAENRGIVKGEVTHGLVCYVGKLDPTKNDYRFDTRIFEITEELRERVYRRVEELESAWERYTSTGLLPDRLPNLMRDGKEVPHWKCKPISTTNPCGLYCEARSSCFSLPPAVSHEAGK